MIRPELNEKELYTLDGSIKEKKVFNHDDIFMMIKRGLILNPEYRKFMGGKMVVYEYLWAHIIRKYDTKDNLKIKEKYYDRGFLACCMSYRELAKECHIGINTVRRYIKAFQKAEILFVHAVDRTYSVFELGRWKELSNGKPQDFYYLYDVFYK